jgi:penicillin amidase
VNLPRLLLRLLLGRRLPTTEGSLRVRGLGGTVRIRRDRWSIPYVEAGNDTDVSFGIGFCQGQDRTFQLELLLRVVRGTLSELFGAAALPVDRLSRRIGFHRAAVLQVHALAPDLRAMLEAYSEGVTAGATLGLPRRPHEFVLIRARPSQWTPADSLAVLKLISFTLASNWDVELARLKVLTADGPEALAAVDPRSPPWLPVTDSPGEAAGAAVDRLAEDFAALTSAALPRGIGGGSNNWTVAAWRTSTGRPLVANDPHLDARLPPHWYLIQARTPDWGMAGATFMGGPCVQAGHNGFAAWGVTAGLVDNTDFFREQIGPDGASVREGDRFVPCEVRDEVIHVRNGPPVTERVLITPRGPIVSPALTDGTEALSLRAVWLDPLPVDGLLRLHQVRSFADFHQAARDWPATSQNVVYADSGGTIGWQIFGLAPRRRKGHGLLPMPGWDTEAGWEAELLPAEQLPHGADPPAGFLATANNQPVPDGCGPFLSTDWLDGYRVASISRRLAARTDWDVSATLALQLDQYAIAWEDLRPAVLAAPDKDFAARQALELLRNWDGRVAVDSPAATVYELFIAEMVGRVVGAKAPRSADWAMGRGFGPLAGYNCFAYRRTGHLARLLREQPPGWFARSWLEEIADALAAVVGRLAGVHGPDPDRWAWGRLHTLTLWHPLGRNRRFAPIFNIGPLPFGGDHDTINQGAVLPFDPLAPVNNIASLRMVVDVGAWHNSRFSLPGGQSGNPLSPHYADLLPLWLRGEGVPIAWTEEEIRQAAIHTLELVPADPPQPRRP